MLSNKRDNIDMRNKEECCGCSACMAICPVGAIIMKEDDEGFKYPLIDNDRCINCGKCRDVCAFEKMSINEPIKHIAAKSLNNECRMSSSSGGVFSALAQFFQEQDGVIYGVKYDANWIPVYERAEKDDEWKSFKSSKYVQSDIKDTYKQVQKDLKNKRKVLFTGTPCQVSGLINFLKEEEKAGLFTCDLICHAAPSPKIWREYLATITKKGKIKISYINFRDKYETGWHNSKLVIKSDNKSLISEGQDENIYFKLFFSHLIIRPACFECKYASMKRVGDITIGDFWGIEKHFSYFDDDKGTSLLLVNTIKGEQVWKQIENKFEYQIVERKECLQPALCRPSEKYANRDLFWRLYRKYGMKWAAKKIGVLPRSLLDKILIKIWNIVGSVDNE